MKKHYIGLAFTSPTVVLPALDDRKFRVHVYEGALSLLREFLTPKVEESDDRKSVVIMTSAYDIEQIGDMDAHAFIICADPVALQAIEGLNTIDCQMGPASQGWRKLSFTPSFLNSLLSSESEQDRVRMCDEKAKSLEDQLSRPATFRELAENALEHIPEKKRSFVEKAICNYAVGILTKRLWTSRVVKALDNVSPYLECVRELVHYVDVSKEGDALWRAYYDHSERDLSLDDASARYKADRKDLEYVISVVPPKSGQKYYTNPKDHPISGG